MDYKKLTKIIDSFASNEVEGPWNVDDDPEDDLDSSEKEDRISELSHRLDQLRIDMENDPEVLAEHGEGGPASDRYGEQMNEIESEINELSSI